MQASPSADGQTAPWYLKSAQKLAGTIKIQLKTIIMLYMFIRCQYISIKFHRISDAF